MNIVILTNAIAPDRVGGSETQSLALAGELGKRNAVRVLVRRFAGRPDIEKKAGFTIIRLGRRTAFPLPTFGFSASVLRELEKDRKNVNCLLAKTIRNGLVGAAARKLWGIPAAVLIESEKEFTEKTGWNRLMLKFVSRNARLLVQTAGLQRELFQWTGEKAVIMPNGVQLRPERDSGDRVIYVGRLIRGQTNDKGVRFLIEAVKGSGVGTIIVGSGPERAALMAQAAGSPNISFVGEVPFETVPDFLLQAFVLVLPSIYGEGLPNVVLEAFSVGLPVIASATGGIPDIIEHGRTGFLVPPGSPRDLRHYIDLLRKDRDLHRRISENCRREAEKYSWEKVARLFEEMLSRAAGC
jgi:glycosyltransferase involved in cell wall biosynthesis